jgi:threonine dehydratase
LPGVETSAGGLEGGLGANAFAVMRGRVSRVALITEDEIFAAVRWLLHEHQYLMEPSAAVTIAAILSGKAGSLAGPAVVVVSGRNVNLPLLQRILAA